MNRSLSIETLSGTIGGTARVVDGNYCHGYRYAHKYTYNSEREQVMRVVVMEYFPVRKRQGEPTGTSRSFSSLAMRLTRETCSTRGYLRESRILINIPYETRTQQSTKTFMRITAPHFSSASSPDTVSTSTSELLSSSHFSCSTSKSMCPAS